MQGKLSNPMPPVAFNALLWVIGVALLIIVKDTIARTLEVDEDDWLPLDLGVALCAYVLLFLLEPIRKRINRRLEKRARRRENRHRS
ncbi:hypothetical protein [Pseudomonas sp.]|uniref:hypothetical protein n=1 Tax=Pseudomonas sp. TaxID=306 RepID=UPI003265338D